MKYNKALTILNTILDVENRARGGGDSGTDIVVWKENPPP